MSRGESAARRTYFFLSYAHVPPTDELTADVTIERQPDPAPDHWVKVFFDELCTEVARAANPADGLDLGHVGFYDPLLPPGSDWKALLADALGSAEVLVPLYSPRYLTWSWPRTEREAFRQRIAASGVDRFGSHVQPVLWTPVPGLESWPDDDRERAVSLGDGIPDYGENGARALRIFSSYRAQYDVLVHRLARRIVDAAERTPLGPAELPKLQAYRGDMDTTGSAPFVVAVLAATADGLPSGRSGDTYGPAGTQWRPFTHGRTVPVAEYAANLAERLGLPARIVSFVVGDAPFAFAPGLLLIDPWVAADDAKRAKLASAIHDLPEWAAPVVIVDPDDPQHGRGAELADVVLGMLPPGDPPRVRDVRGPREFEQLVPFLITQTRGRYLVHGKVVPPAGPPVQRPHLGGGRHQDPEGDR